MGGNVLEFRLTTALLNIWKMSIRRRSGYCIKQLDTSNFPAKSAAAHCGLLKCLDMRAYIMYSSYSCFAHHQLCVKTRTDLFFNETNVKKSAQLLVSQIDIFEQNMRSGWVYSANQMAQTRRSNGIKTTQKTFFEKSRADDIMRNAG